MVVISVLTATLLVMAKAKKRMDNNERCARYRKKHREAYNAYMREYMREYRERLRAN